jgi:hypothetical protein
MAHDVFLSYSYQDKAAADAVCHSLEAKGVRCWIAPRDVIPGEDWQQSILDAIAASRAVILLFTAHTNQSDNVKKEVSAAFDANAMVIPFRIEDVPPQGSLKYHLIGVHWLDAFAPPLEEHVGHLAKIIQGLPLGHGESPPPTPPPIVVPPLIAPGPTPTPSPTPAAETPANWDAVSLDKREGFAFLAAIIPFAPGLYLLWQTTYRQDGDKVTPVSRERKILATLLAALIIIGLLLIVTHLPGRRSEPAVSSDAPASSTPALTSAPDSSAINPSSNSPSSTPTAGAANWSSPSNDSHNRQVTFINGSGHPIWHIMAWSTEAQESDGHDLMGSEVIMPGGSKAYTVDDGAGHCEYNLKATGDSANPTVTASDVNVCGLTSYTLQ